MSCLCGVCGVRGVCGCGVWCVMFCGAHVLSLCVCKVCVCVSKTAKLSFLCCVVCIVCVCVCVKRFL